MATFIDPTTHTYYELSPNLLANQRKLYGKWRYRGPDGLKDLKYYIKDKIENFDKKMLITVEQAIDWANQLNEHFYDIKPEAIPESNIITDTLMMKAAKDFFKEHVMLHPEKKDENYWRDQRRVIERFVAETHGCDINDIQVLKHWFYGIGKWKAQNKQRTYSNLKRNRPAMKLFIGYLTQEGLIKKDGVNPFDMEAKGHFELPARTKKKRTCLTYDEYKLMMAAAIKDKNDTFVFALKFGLETGLRIGDCVSFRFDEWDQETNLAKKTIMKSLKQRGPQQAVKLQWDLGLDYWQSLAGLFNQALATRHDVKTKCGKYITPALHIIHHRPTKVYKSKVKSHYAQLSVREIQEDFAKYREAVPRIAALPQDQKPTFHELRGLFVFMKHQYAFWSIPMLSQVLAHSNIRVTLDKYCVQLEDLNTTKLDNKFFEQIGKEEAA